MKFKYLGKFPMWVEVEGSGRLVQPDEIVESSTFLGEGFEPLQALKSAKKKRKPVDANSTETSSVW